MNLQYSLLLGICSMFFLLFINVTFYSRNIQIIQGFVSQHGYSSRLKPNVVATNQEIQRRIRNLPTVVSTNDTQVILGKCPLLFNCSNGSNPAFEPRMKNMSFLDLQLLYPEIEAGGSWSPRNCDPGKKMAIVIPYRDREEHLKLFLANLIPFLKIQRKAFTIFVIEQTGDALFNRATLMNIGFKEALMMGAYTCFIFSDVDMIPIQLCNLYECTDNAALHLGVSRNRLKPKIIYRDYLGGVLALDNKVMSQINGFPNSMFGWGAEDDAIYARLRKENIEIRHRPAVVGNYFMPHHKRDKSNPRSSRSFQLASTNADHRKVDGLSSLRYNVIKTIPDVLFTKITVNFTGPKTQPEIPEYYSKILQSWKINQEFDKNR